MVLPGLLCLNKKSADKALHNELLEMGVVLRKRDGAVFSFDVSDLYQIYFFPSWCEIVEMLLVSSLSQELSAYF